MLKSDMTRGRKLFAAIVVATALIGSALPGSKFALAASGACALVPNERDPSEKILQCGQELTVRPAHGTSYRPLYKTGQQLPAAIRLDNGALLIEFHPDSQQIEVSNPDAARHRGGSGHEMGDGGQCEREPPLSCSKAQSP